MNRNKNLSKFGTRRDKSNVIDYSTLRVNSLNVLLINGTAVKDSENLDIKQSDDILLLKQSINNLENTVYKLTQIINQLTNANV